MTGHASQLAEAPSDYQLIRRIATDDRRELVLFYDQHEQQLWTVAILLCRDQGAAEAALVRTFALIWQERPSCRPGSDGAYLRAVRLLYQHVLDTRRYQQAVESRRSRLELAASGISTAAVAPWAIPMGGPAGVLDLVPDAQRDILVLAFYGGLMHDQIADLFELSPQTIKERMRLGLHQLDRSRCAVDGTDAGADQLDKRPGGVMKPRAMICLACGFV